MLILTTLLIFLSFGLAGYSIAEVSRRRQVAAETLRGRLSGAAGKSGAQSSILRDERLSNIAWLNVALARLSLTAPLARMIRQAGLSNRVGEVVLYIPLVGGAAGLIAMLVTGNLMMSALIAAAAGSIPLFVVARKRTKRMRLFSEQLPDALDLVRAALQAGHSFTTAMYVVADEFPNPVAEEFRTVAEEVRLGLPLRDALYNLRERVDDPNVPILVVGVLVAQEVGGNLAEVLDNTTDTIRERFKLLRDVMVMTAQGRLSGLVLTALPVVVGIGMFFLNPTYFAPMLTDRRGWYMIGYSIVSVICGHFMIQRLVKIRV
jgi:tight adherence protein B